MPASCPKVFLTCFSVPIAEKAVVSEVFMCMFHCAPVKHTLAHMVRWRVFVHGRMSLDRNKLQKAFQDGISKAFLLIMMSVRLMRAVIDNKQMSRWRRG